MRRPTIEALTVLRFIAAAHVVLYHYGVSALPPRCPAAIQNILSNGYVGVSFFYLLSGFILGYNYTERIGGRGQLRGGTRRFFVNRLSRIYPIYLLAWLVSAPWVISTRIEKDGVSLVAFTKVVFSAITSLTLIQSWIPGAHAWWNPPSWSISVEAFFYLVFPLLVRNLARTRRGWMRLMVCYAAALVVPTVHYVGDGGPLAEAAVKYMPLVHLPVFVLGAFAADEFGRADVRTWIERNRRACTSLGVIGCAVILLQSQGGAYIFMHNGLLSPLLLLVIVGLAARPQDRQGQHVAAPALVMLGNASYSIYILQAPLWIYWQQLDLPLGFADLGAFTCYFVCLCTISVVCYLAVERPAQRAVRLWLLPQGRQDERVS